MMLILMVIVQSQETCRTGLRRMITAMKLALADLAIELASNLDTNVLRQLQQHYR